jgi:iron(III) transport system permease protein
LALPLGVFIAGVLMPALVVAHWIRGLSWAEAAGHFAEEAGWSLKFSGAGAALATALALPVALLRARHPSAWSFALERVPYFGLAMPPLALALSLVFLFRGHGSYAEDGFRFALLSGALALHFMAESVGPLRSALYSRSPRLEEASRGLGASRAATFVRVTLPLLRHAMGVSLALVFLSCMKELPLTMLLAPEGARTLAVRLWSETHEAAFAEAAPRALAVLGISASFVGLLLLRERGAGSRPRRAVSGEGPILQGA